MSEKPANQPNLPPEVIDRLDYDVQVTDQEVFLSPDEAWEVKRFIRGVDTSSPYRSLYLEIDEQYKRGYPTEQPIRLTDKKVIDLAGTYIGILWAKNKDDTVEVQKLHYKIDKVLGALPEDVQSAIREHMEDSA